MEDEPLHPIEKLFPHQAEYREISIWNMDEFPPEVQAEFEEMRRQESAYYEGCDLLEEQHDWDYDGPDPDPPAFFFHEPTFQRYRTWRMKQLRKEGEKHRERRKKYWQSEEGQRLIQRGKEFNRKWMEEQQQKEKEEGR